ncbi:MAG: hypothetical protein KGJ06_06990 [Pseudomonadota bacterium]|nr:hypothetical protein [Pseudomonadota bacterium]
MTNLEQTPAELLDWTINWASRGLGSDTILTSEWSQSSEDFTVSDTSNTGTTATFWLTGGTAGNTYTITNTVTTSGGRTLQETVSYICIPQRLICG